MFFTPRYLRQARELRTAARKLFNYHCDLWSSTQQERASVALQRLDQALRTKQPQEIASASTHLEQLFGELVSPRRYHAFAENIEAIVIAIVLALGVQTYFLKPFKIPTGSMQPTLYGMTGKSETLPPPSLPLRLFNFIRLGRCYLTTTADRDEEIISLEEKTVLNFFTFTKVTTSQGQHTLFAPRDVLLRDFEIRPGRFYQAGEAIAHGYVQAGDQIFCDRFSYAFRKPAAADVFVFITTGIQRIEMTLPPEASSQFYVKRLAALPGEQLRIDPPRLFINDKIPTQPGFLRVIAAQDGYRGYSNGSEHGFSSPYLGSPTDSFTVPPKCYFALGDNSFNSSDSRYWGVVPEQNVIGRALFVYWPFSSRWGLIH